MSFLLSLSSSLLIKKHRSWLGCIWKAAAGFYQASCEICSACWVVSGNRIACLVSVCRSGVWFPGLIATSTMQRWRRLWLTFELRVVSLCRPTLTLDCQLEMTSCCLVMLLLRRVGRGNALTAVGLFVTHGTLC